MDREYVIELFKQHVDVETAEILVTLLEEDGLLTFKVNKSKPDINAIVLGFREAFGTTKTSKFDRFAANRLVKAYGPENVLNVIKALSGLQGQKFCPTVNSVSELETKWVSVGRFLARNTIIEDIM